MHRRSLFPLFLIPLSLLLGCAAKKPFWGNAESGYALTYRFPKGAPVKYTSTTEQHITMEMAGNAMEMELEYSLAYSMLQSGMNEDGNPILRITVDGLEGSLSGMQGRNAPDTEALIGKGFDIEMSPQGRIVEFIDIDALPKVNIGPMAGGDQSVSYFFNNLFPILPDAPVRPEDTWTTTSKEADPDTPGDTMISTVTESKLIGESEADAARLEVETRSEGTVSRSSERMGMNILFEADVENASTWTFDVRQGCLVTLTGNNVIEGSVAMSGQMTQTMPMIIEGSTKTRRLPD